MSGDARYGSTHWKKLRKAVLRRDGHQCMVRGPRCVGIATTVHHIVATSQRPDLFWVEENLVSSCSRCNYGLGRKVAVENGRQEIERLRDAIWQQAQEIEQLRDTIAQLEKPRPMPAIH